MSSILCENRTPGMPCSTIAPSYPPQLLLSGGGGVGLESLGKIRTGNRLKVFFNFFLSRMGGAVLVGEGSISQVNTGQKDNIDPIYGYDPVTFHNIVKLILVKISSKQLPCFRYMYNCTCPCADSQIL